MADAKQNKKPQTMADLLKSAKATFVSLKKGEEVEGRITKLIPSEILVDIGAKSEALVLEKDKKILRTILSTFSVGEKVKVVVLSPESEKGMPVVSLRKVFDQMVWERLESLQKNNQQVEAEVIDTTKGGFIILTKDEITGFLPNSQTLFLESGPSSIGQKIKVNVLELNRPLRKIIFSQKTSTNKKEFEEETKDIRPEQKIRSIISNITPFGMFLNIQRNDKNIEGFIHLSEISWEKLENVPKEYKVGDEIEAVAIGIDKKNLRINLSLKQLTPDPFEKELEKFEVDKKITAPIARVGQSGATVDLGEGIEGFIKREKIPPTVTYKEGVMVTTTVSEVDKKKHRVILVPVLKEKPIGYR